jgi:hypothetical protein
LPVNTITVAAKPFYKSRLKKIANHQRDLESYHVEITNVKVAAKIARADHVDVSASHKEELHCTINDHEVELRDAVQQAKVTEHRHYHDIVDTERNMIVIATTKIDAQQLIIDSFTKNVTSSRRNDCEMERQVNRSAKQSLDLESCLQSTKKLLSTAMDQEKALSMSIVELQRLCDKPTEAMEVMKLVVPIKTIRHERYGSHGQTLWPLYIWELIMK